MLTLTTAETARIALLSKREVDCLRGAAEGHSNKTIAQRMGIEIGTVQVYLKHAFAKLRVHDRTLAVVLLMRAGVIE